MCGIGGIYLKSGYEVAIAPLLREMLRLQRHRGPDGQRAWQLLDGHLGLCHTRLGILDLEARSDQPMHSADDRLTIVFNGEIYNYRELRTELERTGHMFRTRSDTEVLIEAYRAWGQQMLCRLRGMFAFAIYDSHTQILFCARDRVGKKPFVYAETKYGLVFASELPAVKAFTGVDTTFDHDAIAAMLLHNLRHIPDPYTAYRGIKRLRAGHAMIVKDGVILDYWRYWTPTPSGGPYTSEKLRELLEESVLVRQQADVPVGAFLSGGVDSSAIVALMQSNTREPVNTYALGLDKDDEDVVRARAVAKYLGTHHKEYYFHPEEQWDILNRLIKAHGDPIMLLPLVHTYTLSRAVRADGIKVVINGNGADELFYGYVGQSRTLAVSLMLDRLASIRPIFAPLKHTRASLLAAMPGHRKASYYQALSSGVWANCLSKDARSLVKNRAAEELKYWGDLCPSQHYIDESSFTALMVENTHSVTIAGDLPAMAASIEARSPFLDQNIVSFALGTPHDAKILRDKKNVVLKAILRNAVADLMPAEILNAPKRGFGHGIQERALLLGSWKKKAEDLFYQPNTIGGLLSTEAIYKNWENFKKNKSPAGPVAKQLAIQIWAKESI
jgi:asparagine synthase (glutamine-hydrolysing)